MANSLTVPNIECSIKQAIDKTLDDLFNMQGKLNNYDFPEYYLTSRIAHELREDFIDNAGSPYTIFPEIKTNDFARSCVPLMSAVFSLNSIFGSTVISGKKNTSRNGKIDIGIKEADASICCIEVKGDNPNNSDLLKDLCRMTELFEIKDKTGANTLQFAFLPFVIDITKKWYTESRVKNMKETKKKLLSSIHSNDVNWEFVILEDYKYEDEDASDNEDYTEHSARFLYCVYVGIKSKQGVSPCSASAVANDEQSPKPATNGV